MPTSLSGLLLALLSMLTLGISTYLYKQSTAAIGPTNTTFFYYLFSLIIAVGVWIVFGEKQPFEKTALLWPALLAVFLFTSVWAFNYAVNVIDVSVAATLRSLSFLVTIVLAVSISHESLAPKDWVAAALAAVAIVLFGINPQR
jgi:drug/metabolite transporter (DMT)-like permease